MATQRNYPFNAGRRWYPPTSVRTVQTFGGNEKRLCPPSTECFRIPTAHRPKPYTRRPRGVTVNHTAITIRHGPVGIATIHPCHAGVTPVHQGVERLVTKALRVTTVTAVVPHDESSSHNFPLEQCRPRKNAKRDVGALPGISVPTSYVTVDSRADRD